MTSKQIHETAIRLLDGQSVIIDDIKLKAVEVTERRIPCFLCQYFDTCTENMCNVCVELEMYDNKFYRLVSVDEDNEDGITNSSQNEDRDLCC